MLKAMRTPYKVLSTDTKNYEVEETLKKMLSIAKVQNRPCALLIKKGLFEDYNYKTDFFLKDHLLE